VIAKKPYEPPRVRKIKLVPGEMAVSNCKSTQVAPNVCKKGVTITVKAIGS